MCWLPSGERVALRYRWQQELLTGAPFKRVLSELCCILLHRCFSLRWHSFSGAFDLETLSHHTASRMIVQLTYSLES